VTEPIDRQLITLHHEDDVALARRELQAGEVLVLAGGTLTVAREVPAGHKVALRPIAPGTVVHRYGQVIGVATSSIAAGEHVHVHNLAMVEFDRAAAIGSTARPTELVAEGARDHFLGIVRPDGRVATRNFIAVISSVNCAATVARKISQHFAGGVDHAGVDGVIAITHGTGCGLAADGDGLALLRRTITGYARHPNVGGVVIVGLGCEDNQVATLVDELAPSSVPLRSFTIQDSGGTASAVRRGIASVEELLDIASGVVRRPVPVSELVLGLQCGGSDAYSGVSANPALGVAVDLLVRQGGTALLGETPEIYGAEHLLVARAARRDVGEQLLGRIAWWERYTAANGGTMDNNPSPGNKDGGLTTILEKSLGAVAKGGTTNLEEVIGYAESPSAKGLVFMDTPGYDPVSATGMVAGGAHLLCFTTGRGSVFGAKPAPSIKLATNRELFRRMADDMDVDCGSILDGDATVQEVGAQIYAAVVDVASGRPTKSELLGLGDEEMVPWQLGAVM
jgi:altronate hydrolase